MLSFLRISFSLSLKSPSIKFIIFIYIIIAQKHHMFTLISSQYAGKLSLWTKLNGLASCVSYRESEVECRKYQSGGRKFDSFFFHLLVCVCHSLNNIFLILPGLKLTTSSLHMSTTCRHFCISLLNNVKTAYVNS